MKSFKRKGGAISWLTRDLRQSPAPVLTQFEQLLKKLGDSPSGQLNQAIVVTIDAGCLDFNACGLTNSSSSATGFRYEECLQFAFAAGKNPAVRSFTRLSSMVISTFVSFLFRLLCCS